MRKLRVADFLVFALLATVAVAQPPAGDGAQEVVIKINGMFCPFCTFGIEKRLKSLPEVAKVRTDLAAGEAIATLKPGAQFLQQRFARAVKKAGFTHSGISVRPARLEARRTAVPPAVETPQGRPPHTSGGAAFAFVKVMGRRGAAPGQFNQPTTLAFGPEGWFVVSDSGNGRVQQFHPDGRPWRQWSVAGDGKSPLRKPVGVAVGPEGDIWVTDYEADTINRYGPDGAPAGMFGKPGDGPGEFDAPADVAVTSDGLLAVADFYNHRVQLLTRGGRLVLVMGARGPSRRSSSAGLNYPTRVAAGPDGLIWAADAYNHRVVAFDREGRLVRGFGKKGRAPGRFNVSSGIAPLSANRLAVADFTNHRIQIWTSEGQFLADFGFRGSRVGQFERPTDVALAPTGELYVVDWGNHRIQVFREGGRPQ